MLLAEANELGHGDGATPYIPGSSLFLHELPRSIRRHSVNAIRVESSWNLSPEAIRNQFNIEGSIERSATATERQGSDRRRET